MNLETGFEQIHSVPLERGMFGYRGTSGDITVLPDGTLLMAYSNGGIVTRRSTDTGKTWDKEAPLFLDPPTQGRYCHPSFLRLDDGQMLVSYIYNSGTTPYFGHNYYRRSLDNGATWGDQMLLTAMGGYVIVHNDKLRLLSDGRIIAPAEYKKSRPDSDDHRNYASLVFYSDTQGYSWWAADNDIDVQPHESQEAHVAELKDGRLLLLFRTYSGCVGRSYSEDRGQTWSPGELVQDLVMSRRASAITVDRIPTTGDLLLIRCTGASGTEPGAVGRYRTPLVAAISRDDGTTWEHERPIAADPEDDYGYQSVTFVDDLALINYHSRDGLHLARIPVSWFYA
jgi:sialidase-1